MVLDPPTHLQVFLVFFIFFTLTRPLSVETINPFKPEFTIVIFIHYKPRIAVAILDL